MILPPKLKREKVGASSIGTSLFGPSPLGQRLLRSSCLASRVGFAYLRSAANAGMAQTPYSRGNSAISTAANVSVLPPTISQRHFASPAMSAQMIAEIGMRIERAPVKRACCRDNFAMTAECVIAELKYTQIGPGVGANTNHVAERLVG